MTSLKPRQSAICSLVGFFSAVLGHDDANDPAPSGEQVDLPGELSRSEGGHELRRISRPDDVDATGDDDKEAGLLFAGLHEHIAALYGAGAAVHANAGDLGR